MLYFANTDPAVLLSDRGLGRIVYFASSIAPPQQTGTNRDETWNTLPVLPAFVPLAHRTFAFAQSVRFSTRTLTVGDSITGPNSSPRTVTTFSVVREGSDDTLELVNVDLQSANWDSKPIARAGFYHATSADETVFSVAFNTNPVESDLSKTELSRLPTWMTTPVSFTIPVGQNEPSDGAGDWCIVPLLSAVVCMLLLETMATGWEARE